MLFTRMRLPKKRSRGKILNTSHKVRRVESSRAIVTEKGVVRHEVPRRERFVYHKVPVRKGCCHKVDSKEFFSHVLHWEEAPHKEVQREDAHHIITKKELV